MALAAVVETIESVHESIRGEYAKGDDGKFYLNLEGGENLPFVKGLKTALDTERGANRTAKDKVAHWERLGVSPEEIETRLADERAKAEQALVKAGRHDEVLAKKLGDQKLEYDGKIGTAEKQRDSALNIAKTAVINTSLATALTKAKASAEGLAALPKLIGDRVRIEFDDNGNASSSIMDTDGKPMTGSLPSGLANYDDLVKEAIKQYPSLFEGAGGGSGTNQNGQRRDASGKTITRAELNALDPTERMKRMTTGWKVID